MKYLWTLLLLLLPMLVQAESFGNEDEETGEGLIEDCMRGAVFTAPSAGTVDSIKAYIKITTQAHLTKLAIYEWLGSGVAGDLIDSTEEINIPVQGDTWVMFDFILNGSISANTKYSLMAWSEATAGVAYIAYGSSTGDTTHLTSNSYPASWPSTLTPSNVYSNYTNSIVCYYTTGEPPEAAGKIIFINQ